MKEYVIEIHDDRQRYVRIAFRDRGLRDGLYRSIKDRAVNVDFIDKEDVTVETLRRREGSRVNG